MAELPPLEELLLHQELANTVEEEEVTLENTVSRADKVQLLKIALQKTGDSDPLSTPTP